MNNREPLLTLDEICAYLQIPKSWIYQKSHTRTLPFPCVRIGKHLRFRESDIREFIERQAREAQ